MAHERDMNATDALSDPPGAARDEEALRLSEERFPQSELAVAAQAGRFEDEGTFANFCERMVTLNKYWTPVEMP